MTAIILVKPQMGENIGAAARVMLNFGLTDLRIVAPRDGWPNEKAEDMAVGAVEVVKKAKIYKKTEDAIADLNYVFATTGRHRGMKKQAATPENAANYIEKNKKMKVGIMFGAERSGLGNEDIVLANKIISVPVNEKFYSLNLAQAVAIICYEISKKSKKNKILERDKVEMAKKKEVLAMLEHLTQELDKSRFFQPKEKREKMLYNIKNIFTNADLSEQEVRTLRGIIRALAK